MKKIFFVIVIALAIFLRFFHFLDRTSYGWDQMRDLQVLDASIASHHLPLLGPIVRGDLGGFYLGPLYHYLLLPIYQFTNSNPLTLVWFSLAVDILVTIILYKKVSPLAAIIWSVSTMLINSALTPWNVSLIHLWILAVLLLRKYLFLYYLVLSCSTSIHLTLLPIAGFLLLESLPDLFRTRPKIFTLISLVFALTLPQLPLIISDLQTNWSNLRAAKDFFFTHNAANPINIISFGRIFVGKLDATVSRLFFGTPFVGIGIAIFVLLISFAIIYRKSSIIFRALAIITILFVSLWIYHDPDFAEYYFNGLLIPLVIIASTLLAKLPKYLTATIMILLVFSNLHYLSFAPNPYGLGVKKNLISQTIPYLTSTANLKLLIPEHEQFGFAYFLNQNGIALSSDSNRSLVIAPASQEHVPAPPATPSVIFQSSLAAYRVVVFSN